jgi:dienelactone hydrolase
LDLNMVGAYGAFLEQLGAAHDPGLLSFRRPEFTDVEAWRAQAREKALECLVLPDSGGTPQAEVLEKSVVEGVEAELLRWQLPYGPPTEAVFLKPQGAAGPLPGVMALHDHGGMKFFGRHKISDDGRPNHPMFTEYRKDYYGGAAWANELAKRGYAVLCHDTFPFGSRRVRIADVPPPLRFLEGKPVADPPEPRVSVPVDDVWTYNFWAAQHEHIWAKSLASAGSTWPALFLSDDMRALDVLCARPEVDATRIGCCGLSGGGLRTVYLAGLDDRVQAGICVGMMTTWRDYTLHKAYTHTWMVWTPSLVQYLDYPEIIGLRLPKPTMVLYDEEDTLFTLSEMHRADDMLRAIYGKAGAADRYVGTFYPGPHKFDLTMQAQAWEWLDRWIGNR